MSGNGKPTMGKFFMDTFCIFICLDLMMVYVASERQYFFLPKILTWEQARNHCQICFKDLVAVTPENTNLITQSILNTSTEHWIGLRKTFDTLNNSQSAYNSTLNSIDDDNEYTDNSTDSSPTMVWTGWINGDPLSFQNWYPGWPAPKFPLPKIDCCSCSCTCPAAQPVTPSPTNKPLTATSLSTSGAVNNSPSLARAESSTNLGTEKTTGVGSLPTVTDTSVTDSTGHLAATTEEVVNSYTDFTDISTNTDVTDMSNVTGIKSMSNATTSTNQSATNSTRSWESTYTSQITTPYSAHTSTSYWSSQQEQPIESTCDRSPIEPPVIPEPYDNYIEDSCVAMLSFGPWIEKNCFEVLPFICYEDRFIGFVTVTNITSSSATLSWQSPPGGSISYRVDVQSNATIPKVNCTTDLTCDLFSLTPGTHYSVQVFPIKCDRELNPENATFYTVPLKAGNLIVTDVTSTSVSLNWSRPDGNLDFYLITTGNLGEKSQIESLVFGGLTPGFSYTFTVLTGVADNSSWSEGTNVTAYTKPGNVINLNASNNNDTALTLTWTSPAGGFTGFIVEAYNSKDALLFFNNVITNGTTVFNLTSGDIITLSVTAVANYTLLGETASIPSFTTPDPISNLTLTTDNNSLTASWSYTQNINILFTIDIFGNSGDNHSQSTSSHSTQFPGLKTGANYTVIVHASNGVHSSPNVSAFRTTLPNPPTNQKVESQTNHSITFAWSPPENAGQGLLYDVNIISNFWNYSHNASNINDTRYTFVNLTSGTTYNFSVRAYTYNLKSVYVNCSGMTDSVDMRIGLSMMCSSITSLNCDNITTRTEVFQALKTHFNTWLGSDIMWNITQM